VSDPKIRPRDYGLTGQLGAIVAAANYDPDQACMLTLGNSRDDLDGAVVVLKGGDLVEEFRRWAASHRYLTLGKPSTLAKALQEGKVRS